MRYYVFEMTSQLPVSDIFVYLGDDSVLTLPRDIDLPFFEKFAYEQFSMRFNTEKSYVTRNPANIHFLGYLNQSGRISRIDTIIASTIYAERPVH